MENIKIKLRDGLAVSGKVTDTVLFHYKNGLVDFEITDGCYDRNFRLDAENSRELMTLLNITDDEKAQTILFNVFEKNNDKDSNFYINKFKTICQEYGIEYKYSAWMSSD